MQQKVYFTNSKNQKLAAWLHVPEGKGPFPAVIRSHGYRSSKDGSKSVLLAEQFTSCIFFRFDFNGHGESEGKIEDIDALQCVDDLTKAIDYVLALPNVDKKRIAITGSSLGGLAATLAGAWHNRIACAVLVCPVSDFRPLREHNIKYKSLMQYDVYHEAEKITCPVLIIHGSKDESVPLDQSVELARHLRRGTLHITPGADHSFSNPDHAEQLIEQTVEFIKSVLK